VNEIFGQTEINYIVGNSHTLWPAKPGSIGRPYPDTASPASTKGEAKSRLEKSENWRPGRKTTLSFFWSTGGIPRRRAGSTQDNGGRTGDLAKRDDDGDFWVQGRADDVFKSAGYRIGPAEIENCLVRHPASRMPRWWASPMRSAPTSSSPSSCLRPATKLPRPWRPSCRNTCAAGSRLTSIPRSSSFSTACR